MTTTTAICIVVIAAVLVAVAGAVAASRQSRARKEALRRRFGPEYDRAIEQYGGAARAERHLAARAKRVDRLRLRDLDEINRARFAMTWNGIQARFVDDPSRAVREANELIKDVMLVIGYPADEFDQRTADLSVDHPNVVQHYRAAHALAKSNLEKKLDTEELRQAIVHYRALFSELIDRTPVPPMAQLRAAHS